MKNIAPMTIKEAAEQSGIRYSLLRGAVRNGRLPTVIISKRPMITDRSLNRFLAELNEDTPKARPAA